MEDSVRMHNAKYELLRHFNEPLGAQENIARLHVLVIDGLRTDQNKAGKYHNIDPEDLAAASWLADLGKIVNEFLALETFDESFNPGKRIEERVDSEQVA